jgi:hypothetical protein
MTEMTQLQSLFCFLFYIFTYIYINKKRKCALNVHFLGEGKNSQQTAMHF